MINIDKLHQAHFTPGVQKSGQTTYQLDSLIRVIQLGEFKNLVFVTPYSRFVDTCITTFIRHLLNAKIEYQFYPAQKMFAVRDNNHTAKVWFKSSGNVRLEGFSNCFIIEDN